VNVVADLHIHTTASDGRFSPAECVAKATALGLRAIAVTDHDTMAGVAEAQAAATSLAVLSGVEFGCHWDNRPEIEVHILGYGCTADHPELAAELQALRNARDSRAEATVSKLASLGLTIDLADVMRLAGGGSVGRPHIAQALLERGYVDSVADAFSRYLSPGKPGYVGHYRLSTQRAIELITLAGGVPVLAHPGLIGNAGVVAAVICQGIRGIEVWHPQHTPADVRFYRRLARQRGLLATGGSDFHGIGPDGSELGSCGVALEQLVDLQTAVASA
jgi:predicted metal-dependent phosphoesterase TrpH